MVRRGAPSGAIRSCVWRPCRQGVATTGVGTPEGVEVGVGVGTPEGVGVGVDVGEGLPEDVDVGVSSAAAVGWASGLAVGSPEGVGSAIGVGLGVGTGPPPVQVPVAPDRHSHSRGVIPDAWICAASQRPTYRKCQGSYL